ncbi:MAG: translation initiation factor IF-3 [Thermodesulfobacteriota bacterium]|nr:MAG: translation initiation factor IF-3 [Thermodesulfobacteriota bacterium]
MIGIVTEKNRINYEIRCPAILVIDMEGQQLGVMPPQEAMKRAEEQGLDLVEVAPNANPPVCRIMDYGKFKYQQRKKAQETRKKKVHSNTTVKEIKLRPRTEDHDLFFKIRNLKKFLANRNKIKISLQFRGREMAHLELGKKMMDRIVEEIKEVAIIEQGAKLEGRFMTMVVGPKS